MLAKDIIVKIDFEYGEVITCIGFILLGCTSMWMYDDMHVAMYACNHSININDCYSNIIMHVEM